MSRDPIAYNGPCPSCRAYIETNNAMRAEWYAATGSTRSDLGRQVALGLTMYMQHVFGGHAGIEPAGQP